MKGPPLAHVIYTNLCQRCLLAIEIDQTRLSRCVAFAVLLAGQPTWLSPIWLLCTPLWVSDREQRKGSFHPLLQLLLLSTAFSSWAIRTGPLHQHQQPAYAPVGAKLIWKGCFCILRGDFQLVRIDVSFRHQTGLKDAALINPVLKVDLFPGARASRTLTLDVIPHF